MATSHRPTGPSFYESFCKWLVSNKDPLMHQVSYKGNVRKLLSLLQHKKHAKELNARNRLGCSPLRLAATAGHVECVALLLKHGAETESEDMKAQTSLLVAVKKGHLECMQLLLAHDADPNGSAGSLCTPLFAASLKGYLPGLKLLIEYGALLDYSTVDPKELNSTPLYITIAYKHIECFKELLIAGADPDYSFKFSPGLRWLFPKQSLYHVAIRHDVEVTYAQLLYEHGANLFHPDERGVLARDMYSDNISASYIKTLYDCPRSLLMQCRISIRRALLCSANNRRKSNYEALAGIRTLPLPAQLCKYLQHENQGADC